MLYSSGTTGRPKGVKRAAPASRSTAANGLATLGQALYGWTPDSVYLSPAPLYHAAPLGWSMAVQALGGTVILMERFDPEDALRLIEKHKVTTAQWVPTHFRPHAEAAAGGARPVRPLVAEGGVPRRRALSGAGQGADDRLVGPDHQRVLRRHRGQRLHRHQLGRSGWPTRARSAGADRAGDDLRRGRRAAAAARRGGRSISPAAASSSTTTTRPRPPRAATSTAGPRWATWAGWTRRAISTSPTARAS
jgi:hypothetical protein